MSATILRAPELSLGLCRTKVHDVFEYARVKLPQTHVEQVKRPSKEQVATVPTVQSLGPVESGLQFEPCRFPVAATTASNQEPFGSRDSSLLPVFSLNNDLLTGKSSFESPAQFAKTAWAHLIHNYTRTEIISYAQLGKHEEDDDLDSDFIRTIVARFPAEDSSALRNGVCEMSDRFVSAHVLKEKQLNVAINLVGGSEHESSDLPFDLVLIANQSRLNLHLSMFFRHSAISKAYGAVISHTLRQIVVLLARYRNSPLVPTQFSSFTDTQITRRWNSKPLFESWNCLHHLVQKSLWLGPQREAVCAWDGSFTCQELWDHSTYWAERLNLLGVRPGMLVPFAFEKSRWAVVAMLSILRAGGALVPLDPEHPLARLQELCSNVGGKVLLTSAVYAEKLNGLVVDVVTVSSFSPDCSSDTPGVLLPETSPSDPAIVLFTSGSTGRPKGIIHEHRSACTHSMAHGGQLGYKKARVLQFSAYTWDVAMIDVFTTLIFEGCVCIPSEADRRLNISHAIQHMEVGLAFLTPSFASLIDPSTVPSLHTLILSGEALKQNVVRQWANVVSLFQGYGPAEVGVCTTVKLLSSDSCAETVGRPCNSVCFLVDPEDHQKLMPIGATGELVVGGPSIARKYLNDHNKTSLSFFENPPWSQGLGHEYRRFYKTGDLLRYNTRSMDGSLDFVGRIGSQIKRHGQRVEVGEIEYHISNIPAVGISMVAEPKTGCYKGDLVAVVQLHESLAAEAHHQPLAVVSTSTAEMSQAILIRRLSDHLPRYMIPTALLIVKGMPLSSSRKLERNQVHAWLSSLESRANSQGKEFHGPGLDAKLRETEKTALFINSKISGMLGKDDAAYHDRLSGYDFNLQQAGVNSIHIISLSLFLQKAYKIKVPLPMLMSSKVTVRDLAEAVDLRSLVVSDTGSVDSLKEAAVIIEETLADKQVKRAMYHPVPPRQKSRVRVLLTGSTGYLGTEILRQLLHIPDVLVVVLVRASGPTEAMLRVTRRAVQDGWWEDRYASRIEAWPGDLSKPDLDLTPAQLLCLRGEATDVPCINVVVQNAAMVHYNLDYDTVRSTNVTSTQDLLQMSAISRTMSSFVYVSGGQQIQPGEDDDVEMSQRVQTTGGYEQSKLVAELVVKRFANELQIRHQTLSVVKPGYIVGNQETGLANPADFVWRLVQGCLEIGAYNAAEADHWLFIADKDRVAASVVSAALHDDGDEAAHGHQIVRKMLAGIRIRDFWALLRDLGYHVEPAPYADWLTRIRRAILARLEDHPLFPVIHILERGCSIIGSDQAPATVHQGILMMTEALRRNVRYLIDRGTLPQPHLQAEPFFSSSSSSSRGA